MLKTNDNFASVSRQTRFAITLSLLLAWFSPVLSTLTKMPRLSGVETLPLLFIILHFSLTKYNFTLGKSPYLLLFLLFTLCTLIINNSLIAAWFFCLVLLIVPFFILPLMELMNPRDRILLRRNFFSVLLIQFVWCIYQIFSDGNVDRVKGTLIGTGAGAHIASFFLIIGSHLYFVKSDSSLKRRISLMLIAIAICILADAKQVLLYYFLVIIFTAIKTKAKEILPKHRLIKFLAPLLISTVGLSYLLTGFGGIKGYNYIKLTLDSDGGKLAVTKIIANPDSSFWKTNNYLLGTGPATTVSRSSGMTVPGFEGHAPARKFGLHESKYYLYFVKVASGRGYVGDSSATSPASSLLGVLGDFGFLGLLFYLLTLRELIAKRKDLKHSSSNWRNSFAFTYIVGLGFISEWPEFTVATITLCIFLELAYGNE